MTQDGTLLYTAAAKVEGGRGGTARTASGRLEVALSRPADPQGEGTNPEELFAAGYAACFDSALAVAARRLRLSIGPTVTAAEIDLVEQPDGSYSLRARLVVQAPEAVSDELADVVDLADRLCPYSRAVRGNVPVEISVDAG